MVRYGRKNIDCIILSETGLDFVRLINVNLIPCVTLRHSEHITRSTNSQTLIRIRLNPIHTTISSVFVIHIN